MHLFAVCGLDAPYIGIGGGDGIHLWRDKAVDSTEHGILFVDHRRHMIGKGGKQRRKGRITAKTDDTAWLKMMVQLPRHAASLCDAARRAKPAARASAHSAGRKDMPGKLFRTAGDFHATIIGDQSNMMPARDQFDRQRIGRHYMPARAACCQNIMFGNRHTPPFTI